jgi:hypothetical protein
MPVHGGRMGMNDAAQNTDIYVHWELPKIINPHFHYFDFAALIATSEHRL